MPAAIKPFEIGIVLPFQGGFLNESSRKIKPSEKGRKYAYKINFTQAVKICRNHLKKKISEENVIKDIEKFIESVRTGRSSPRNKSPKRDVFFTYRIA